MKHDTNRQNIFDMSAGMGRLILMNAMNDAASEIQYKVASAIITGDKVVERDGAFFEVESVQKVGRSLVLVLRNINGYMVAPTSAKVSARAQVRILAA